MINGNNVGIHYNTALNGYAAEKRSPEQLISFRNMLRGCTSAELTDWYELYVDSIIVGKTRLLKTKQVSVNT